MTDIETVIMLNKNRFYEFYYEIRDDYLIPSTESDKNDTFSKPSAQSCMLVKRVFDNYLVIPEMNDFLKIVEVLRFCNDLITNGDIFELVNVSSMNTLFTQIYNYGIILSELENGGCMVKNILTHIGKQKLKSGLLECLIYIIYRNLVDVSGVASRTNSHETVCTGIESPAPNVNSTATNVTPNSRSRLSSRVEMGLDFNVSGIRKLSTSNCDISSSMADSNTKPSHVSAINIYNYISYWVFAKYKARMFWMSYEIYSVCLKLLRFNTILSEDTLTLISQTLKRFIRNDLLISKITQKWYNDYELIESLNILKNKIITKEQQWIKQLLKQYIQTLPIIPDSGKKVNLVLIDGANWFYNPRATGGKSNLLRDEIDNIGTPIWNDVIICRIRTQMRDKFGYEPNEYFIKNLRIIIVFNERHRPFIHQICADLDQFIIYTPRGMNDDAMLLYLWLSNPGAFLFSNDQYNDWSNHVTGNHYLMGLWAHWTALMKINK